MPTVEPMFELAVRYHRGGETRHAARLYRQIIQTEPGHALAHANLGAALLSIGDTQEALLCLHEALRLDPTLADAHFFMANFFMKSGDMARATKCLTETIALNPRHADAHNNLGIALAGRGRLAEATACFRRVVLLNPLHVDALINLGNALKNQGQLGEAVQCFREAVRLQAGRAEAHYNLGNTLKAQGQPAEAAECLREALRLDPRHADAHNNLGIVLCEQKRLGEAAECFRQAVRINRRHGDAHNNLGIVLFEQKKFAQAAECFQRALSVNPGVAATHNHLGNALFAQGDLGGASACYRQALRLSPDDADVHYNLGNVLHDQGLLEEAIASYRHILRLQPKHAEALVNLGNCLKDEGALEEALACYRKAVDLKPSYARAHSNLVNTLHFLPGQDAALLLGECRRWNQVHATPLKKSILPHANDKAPERRLRIGYLSPDLREHPVGRFLLPALAAHNHDQFQIFCYSAVKRPDRLTDRCRALADGWRNLAFSTDDQAAHLIRRDKIDVLVDLAMHTGNNRLLVFARKPAPVQVTYLAYCGTTGLDAMDYRLTDPYLDPPGRGDQFYSEKSIRLPASNWCYQPVVETPEPVALPALQVGHVTFGCLNNFCKVTTPTLEAWSTLLKAVPGSHLLLCAPVGSHRDRVRQFFAERSIVPGRVLFVDRVPIADYFRTYDQIDIALDPFPHGGGTTTCDALWMGVPVVSLAGETSVGRGGVSILSNIGLAELVARHTEHYVGIAANLAGNLAGVAKLRATLRERMRASPLMDAASFTRGLEQAYRTMWRQWCGQGRRQIPGAGKAPVPSVPKALRGSPFDEPICGERMEER